MKYFETLPKEFYQLETEESLEVVTNITSRVAFNQSIKSNASSFYDYIIMEGDTPEILASKFYSSPNRHWIILLLNDIVDPLSQWPLNDRSLMKHIEKKYKDMAGATPVLNWTKANIKTYEKIETQINIVSGVETDSYVERKIIDQNTYTNLIPSTQTYTLQSGKLIKIVVQKVATSYFDYEVNLNESKRRIKLLRPEFVEFVEREFRDLYA